MLDESPIEEFELEGRVMQHDDTVKDLQLPAKQLNIADGYRIKMDGN